MLFQHCPTQPAHNSEYLLHVLVFWKPRPTETASQCPAKKGNVRGIHLRVLHVVAKGFEPNCSCQGLGPKSSKMDGWLKMLKGRLNQKHPNLAHVLLSSTLLVNLSYFHHLQSLLEANFVHQVFQDNDRMRRQCTKDRLMKPRKTHDRIALRPVRSSRNLKHAFLPSLKLTDSQHLKMGLPKRKQSYSNHPLLGAMLVSGRVMVVRQKLKILSISQCCEYEFESSSWL